MKRLFVLAACAFSACLAAWQENVRPKMYVQLGAEDDVHHFVGNDTRTDYFRLMLRDGDSLLVGGRNLVYNLSLSDLNQQQKLTWFSNEHDAKMCVMKGKDEENCQNYIRIMAKTAAGRLLLCGTNAFKPVCREYNILSGNYTMEKEKPGQAVCPYDPHHNSTAIYVDGDLYTGTVADFSGMDPIIYREPLQTEQYDSMSLNAPDFVSSMTQKDFVYFFFRETAVEYINCGKAVYSRVARVCKNDRGGPHRFRNRWTSFLKSRLNCSVTGEFPFYFNEIQSTTELIEGQYGDVYAQLIYGTFTTPPNSISGSAVCAFSLQDITDTFEGNFKEQSAINSNWLPVQSSKVPDPRPGQCHNDSRTLPDLTLNFIKTHSLMDESVPSFFGQPIVIRTIFHYRFTQIAVDPQVKVPGGKTYDVLFIGTDNGKIIKAVNGLSAETRYGVRPVVVEEIQVFPVHVPVRGIKVVRNSKNEGRLVVISDGEVQSLRLHRCDSNKISSCSECVALQDPYCAWDKVQGKCRSHGSGRWGDESYFFQSVATGQHTACPPPKLGKDAGSVGGLSSSQPKFNQDHQPSKDQPDGQVINIVQDKTYESNDPAVSAADTLPAQYSVETLIMAVVAGAVSALVVGFIAGYLCGRKCHKDEDDNLPYPDTEYEYFEQRQNMNRIQAEPKLLPQEEVTYAEPVLVPQPPPKLHSPKNTLRKGPHQNNSETLFQFQTDAGYNGRDNYRGRDNFGTLRSHQEISNIDTVVSVSDEHRKIILLDRQLLENKHKLEQLKLNDEMQMLKLKNEMQMLKLKDEIQTLKLNNEIQILKHTLDMLQVQQSFTNWEAMRRVNVLNIRSFIYEFKSKHFTEFGHIKTRREKYSAFAKKNLTILKKYCATEDLFVDFIMGFYKRQCKSAHPEFNVNPAIVIQESFMLKQDEEGPLCIQKYLDKHQDEW